MARQINIIQQQILDSIAADPVLSVNLTSTSKRAIYRLFTYMVAVAVNTLEQLIDIFTLNVEAIAATVPATNALWIQSKMFAFQYSAITPQVVQIINTIAQYPVIDTTLQLITACSVTSDQSNSVNIKVAKGNPFIALVTAEIASAQGYINLIGTAGINYTVISLNPDKLYINANIFYAGQYAAIIQANVIAAINAYLQQLSKINFNGSLRMSDLEGLIRGVPGVNDVVLINVRGRADTDAFSAGVDFILGQTVLQREWKTASGYIVQETTAGSTFINTLNFIGQ
jgi:hypothetical protein